MDTFLEIIKEADQKYFLRCISVTMDKNKFFYSLN